MGCLGGSAGLSVGSDYDIQFLESEPCVGLPAQRGACFSLLLWPASPLSLAHALSLSQINKIFLKNLGVRGN